MSIKGRYVKIATKFWSDEKIINLGSKTKLLYQYILSSPHSNMAGYYRLPKPYIKADLKLTDKELDKGLGELIDKGLIKYCEESSVVLIPKYFKYNTIHNSNQAKGAANRTSELPKNSLVDDYIEAVKDHASKHEEQLLKGLPKRLDKQTNKQTEKTELELETDTELDNKKSSDSAEPEFPSPENNEECSPKFGADTKPYKTAAYLREKILENNNRQPVPDENPSDLEGWAVEMDRLNRLGPVGAKESEDKNYTWPEIIELIDWCQDDPFWKGNILSASKFRKKIVTLENQMKNDKGGKSSAGTGGKGFSDNSGGKERETAGEWLERKRKENKAASS